VKLFGVGVTVEVGSTASGSTASGDLDVVEFEARLLMGLILI
jgi:hypothetical protein